jgi:hypothetical protein
LRDRLHSWARGRDEIRGAATFGSTQRQDRPADDWSDLDLLFVEIAVHRERTLEPFANRRLERHPGTAG